MAGDLKNNICKLESMLKKVKYSTQADMKGVVQGQSSAFFPIYHYLFVNYSQPFSNKLVEKNVELYGKTDLRFIEVMYRILRDMFNYKPPITKEQFFSGGFIEKKIIMCTDILGLVYQEHQSLVPKQPKQFKNPTPFAFGNPKPAQVRDSSSTSIGSLKSDDGKEKSTMKKPQVVKECRNPSNKYVSRRPNTPCRNSSTTDPQNLPSPIKNCGEGTPESPVITGNGLKTRRTPQSYPKRYMPNRKIKPTPYPGRTWAPPEVSIVGGENYEDESQDPIEIIAMTPGSGPLRANHRIGGTHELAQLTSKVQEVSEKLASFESRLCAVEQMTTQLSQVEAGNTRDAGVPNLIQDQKPKVATFTPSQVENLLARLTILENKVAIMDSQPLRKYAPVVEEASPARVGCKTGLVQGIFDGSPRSPTPRSPAENETPVNVLSPISVLARDNMPDIAMSPEASIILNPENAGTRSSTPEENAKQDTSLSVHFVDTPTCNKAKRIFDMIRDTEVMMRDENQVPQEEE